MTHLFVIPYKCPSASTTAVSIFTSLAWAQILTVCVYLYQLGLGLDPDSEEPRIPPVLWNACAFTVTAIGKLKQLYTISLRPVGIMEGFLEFFYFFIFFPPQEFFFKDYLKLLIKSKRQFLLFHKKIYCSWDFGIFPQFCVYFCVYFMG